MAKEKIVTVRMDKAFFDKVKRDYCKPRDIDMSTAIRSALRDALVLSGVEWNRNIEDYYVKDEER